MDCSLQKGKSNTDQCRWKGFLRPDAIANLNLKLIGHSSNCNGKTIVCKCVYIIISTQPTLVEVCTRNKKNCIIYLSDAIYQLESAANLDSAKAAGGTSTAVGGGFLLLDRSELIDDDKFDGRSGGFLLSVLLLRKRQRIPAVTLLLFISPFSVSFGLFTVTSLPSPLLALALVSQAEAIGGELGLGCACVISMVAGKIVDCIGKGSPVGMMGGAVPPYVYGSWSGAMRRSTTGRQSASLPLKICTLSLVT